MGRGVISFEKGKAGSQDIILFVFRAPIGTMLYTGRLDGNQTKIRRIAEKATKNQLKVRLLTVKPDPVTKKFKFEDIIISFTRDKDLADFETEITEALSGIK
jgi:hypothetical protein